MPPSRGRRCPSGGRAPAWSNAPARGRNPRLRRPAAVSFGLAPAGRDRHPAHPRLRCRRRRRASEVSQIGAVAGRPVPSLPARSPSPASSRPRCAAPQAATRAAGSCSRRGDVVRRIPYWARVETAALPAPARRLSAPGRLPRDAPPAGRAQVDVYRYPEVPPGTRIAASSTGRSSSSASCCAGRPANFGVAIVSRAPGVRVEPRVVHAGSEDRLVGYTGLPIHCNPYLPEFLDTRSWPAPSGRVPARTTSSSTAARWAARGASRSASGSATVRRRPRARLADRPRAAARSPSASPTAEQASTRPRSRSRSTARRGPGDAGRPLTIDPAGLARVATGHRPRVGLPGEPEHGERAAHPPEHASLLALVRIGALPRARAAADGLAEDPALAVAPQLAADRGRQPASTSTESISTAASTQNIRGA